MTTDLDLLDIDNPNDVVNKLYSYLISDDGTTASTRVYTVTATRNGVPTTYVAWQQTDNDTGQIYRSANLGGPTL